MAVVAAICGDRTINESINYQFFQFTAVKEQVGQIFKDQTMSKYCLQQRKPLVTIKYFPTSVRLFFKLSLSYNYEIYTFIYFLNIFLLHFVAVHIPL